MPKYKKRNPRNVRQSNHSRRSVARRNPVITTDTDDFDYHGPINLGPYGLPTDPIQSFELGRLTGLQRGLNLCTIRNTFKRWRISKKIEKEMKEWLNSLSLQAEAVARGTIGAKIPTIRQGEGGIPKRKSGR